MTLRPLLESSFVGREKEIGALEAQLAEALAGHGRLVTISGEAGVGKTRAAEELLARSGLPSGRLLWGRCPEQPGAPAYWPWTQALRGYVEQADRDAVLPARARERPLARFRPSRAPGSVGLGRSSNRRSRTSNFSTRWLDSSVVHRARGARDRSRRSPLGGSRVHSALAFLTHELAACWFVVGTYRRTRSKAARPLGGLRRASERVRLRGLDRADVGRLAQGVTGPPQRADWSRTSTGSPRAIRSSSVSSCVCSRARARSRATISTPSRSGSRRSSAVRSIGAWDTWTRTSEIFSRWLPWSDASSTSPCFKWPAISRQTGSWSGWRRRWKRSS